MLKFAKCMMRASTMCALVHILDAAKKMLNPPIVITHPTNIKCKFVHARDLNSHFSLFLIMLGNIFAIRILTGM